MKSMFAPVVIFIALSLASVAMAQGKTYPLNYSLKGEIVSVDLLSRTLVIRPAEKMPFDMGTQSTFTFHMNEMANVRMCDQDKTVADIKVGEKVTVMYHTEGGTLYADSVDIPTPLVTCMLE